MGREIEDQRLETGNWKIEPLISKHEPNQWRIQRSYTTQFESKAKVKAKAKAKAMAMAMAKAKDKMIHLST